MTTYVIPAKAGTQIWLNFFELITAKTLKNTTKPGFPLSRE
jgi:hypothetical protein